MEDEDTQDEHVLFFLLLINQIDELLNVIENELTISGITYNISKLTEKINNEKAQSNLTFTQIV